MRAARIVSCAAGALLLAGCLGTVPESNPDNSDDKAQAGLAAFFARTGPDNAPRKAPLSKVALAGGDVVVSGPDGYCIDPETKRSGAERGFVVIASCHILSGGRAGRSVAPMLLTVTVGPRGGIADLPSPEALAKAAGSQLLDGKSSADRVFAHLAEGGDRMFDGSDQKYWRAAFLQGDRLVGLALYAPRGSDLAAGRGEQMLARVKDRIAKQSPKGPSGPEPRPKKAGGLLGQLFNR